MHVRRIGPIGTGCAALVACFALRCGRRNGPQAQCSRCNGVRRALRRFWDRLRDHGVLQRRILEMRVLQRRVLEMQRPRQAKQSGLQSQKRGGFVQTIAGEAPGPLATFQLHHGLRLEGDRGVVETIKRMTWMVRTDTHRLETLLRKRDYTHTYKETHLRELRHTNARRAFRYTNLVHLSRSNARSKVRASGSRGGRPCSWHLQKRQRLLRKHDTFHTGDVGSNVEWASTQIRNARYKTHY